MRKCKITFKKNFRMSTESFDHIFRLIEGHLTDKKNNRPDKIPPRQKLAMVLETLASGTLQRQVAHHYRVSKQHFGYIINDVCDAICLVMKEEIKTPTEEEYIQIANTFHAKWNFPNFLGAVDGSHIPIRRPPGSASIFFNHKGTFSIILVAAADANYRFCFINVGAYGSESDGSAFITSKLGRAIMNDVIAVPDGATINNVRVPFFFVADRSFPLCKRIMKPYVPARREILTPAQNIFNYRLSRARRTIENAFGILKSRWMCLARKMYCGPDKAQKIITTCCLLHNFLLSTARHNYCPPSYADRIGRDGRVIEGAWRSVLLQDPLLQNNNMSRNNTTGLQKNDNMLQIGMDIRNHIKNYVISQQGALAWQNEYAHVNL